MFNFKPHVTGSGKVRVAFDEHVTHSALNKDAYVISSLAPMGTAVVPAVSSVEFYDSSERSVLLTLEGSLTFSKEYEIQISGVGDVNGGSVTSTPQPFTANVPDPPRVVGTFLSKKGCVDVLFDRPVGPSSVAATGTVVDLDAPGAPQALTLLPWDTESMPSNALRFSLPVSTPSAVRFSLTVSSVVDASLNQANVEAILEPSLRTPAPWDLAALSQLQIIDAYVDDVSNDYIGLGKIRVFFNGPADGSSATTVGNWTVTAVPPHKVTDVVNPVTSPDCFDLGTLLILCSEIRVNFNAHVVATDVHLSDGSVNAISTVPADLVTAAAFLNEAQADFLNHLANESVHEYGDSYNSFIPLNADPGIPALVFAIANDLKDAFNAHLQPEYPAVFTNFYSAAIGNVTSFAQLDPPFVQAVVDSFSLFVDLHVRIASPRTAMNVSATVMSEDGSSFTNPGDVTGRVTARPRSSPARLLAASVSPSGSLSLRFDREVAITSLDSVRVTGPDGPVPCAIRLRPTLHHLSWAFNSIVTSYSLHITSVVGASHQVTDTTNLISVSDYSRGTFESLISAANAFKAKLNSHMSNGVFHFASDSDLVTEPDASDMDGLVALVSGIRGAYHRHNVRIGPHFERGTRVDSSSLMDQIILNFPMRQGGGYEVRVEARDFYHDNTAGGGVKPDGRDFFHELSLLVPVIGMGTPPALASAIPISGLVRSDLGTHLERDLIEIYFSKPMRQEDLGSSLSVSGGTLITTGFLWTGKDKAAVVVSSMEEVPYSMQASNLTDEVGNSVI